VTALSVLQQHFGILALKVSAIALSFLMTWILARFYSPVAVGHFFLFFAAMKVVADLGKFGQDMIGVRELAAVNKPRTVDLRESQRIIFEKLPIVAIVPASLSFAYAFGALQGDATVLAEIGVFAYVLPVAATVYTLQQFLAAMMQGLGQYSLHVLTQSIVLPADVVLCLGVAELFELSGSPLSYLLFGVAIAFLGTGLILGRSIWSSAAPWRYRMPAMRRRLLREGGYFFATRASAQLGQWLPVVILGLFVTTEDVGQFSIALQVATLLTVIQTVTNVRFAPRFARLYSEGRMSALRSEFASARRLNIVFTAPFALLVLVFAKPLLGFFSEEYSDASLDLMILVIAQLIGVAVGPIGYLLAMAGKAKLQAAIFMGTGAIALSSSVVLINIEGRVGAAVCVAIMIIGTNVISFFFAREILHVKPGHS